ncbi:MAG: hypothetical protein M1840_006554 [Geoglossum simile]|nr:MAG: hypothetical protein M1840_006554 [Geoglossum simile]
MCPDSAIYSVRRPPLSGILKVIRQALTQEHICFLVTPFLDINNNSMMKSLNFDYVRQVEFGCNYPVFLRDAGGNLVSGDLASSQVSLATAVAGSAGGSVAPVKLGQLAVDCCESANADADDIWYDISLHDQESIYDRVPVIWEDGALATGALTFPMSASEDNNSLDEGWVFAECERAGPGEAKKEGGIIEDPYAVPGSHRYPCNSTRQHNSGNGKRVRRRKLDLKSKHFIDNNRVAMWLADLPTCSPDDVFETTGPPLSPAPDNAS